MTHEYMKEKINRLIQTGEYIDNIDDIDDIFSIFSEEEMSYKEKIELLHLINEHNMSLYNSNVQTNKKYSETMHYDKTSIVSHKQTAKTTQAKSINNIDEIINPIWEKVKVAKDISHMISLLPSREDIKFNLIINHLILKFVEEEKITLDLMRLIDFEKEREDYEQVNEELEEIRNRRLALIEYRNLKIKDKKEEVSVSNNLIFLRQLSNNYCMDGDLKDFTTENYQLLLGLLESIKDGTFKNSKALAGNSNLRGSLEVKDGQVRVQYVNVKDNNYVILSAFIKKCDKSSEISNLMGDRNDLYLRSAEYIKQILESDSSDDYLTENQEYYLELKNTLLGKEKVKRGGQL